VSYRKGRRYEYELRDILRELGWAAERRVLSGRAFAVKSGVIARHRSGAVFHFAVRYRRELPRKLFERRLNAPGRPCLILGRRKLLVEVTQIKVDDWKWFTDWEADEGPRIDAFALRSARHGWLLIWRDDLRLRVFLGLCKRGEETHDEEAPDSEAQ